MKALVSACPNPASLLACTLQASQSRLVAAQRAARPPRARTAQKKRCMGWGEGRRGEPAHDLAGVHAQCGGMAAWRDGWLAGGRAAYYLLDEASMEIDAGSEAHHSRRHGKPTHHFFKRTRIRPPSCWSPATLAATLSSHTLRTQQTLLAHTRPPSWGVNGMPENLVKRPVRDDEIEDMFLVKIEIVCYFEELRWQAFAAAHHGRTSYLY
jgi:hypothetical protein